MAAARSFDSAYAELRRGRWHPVYYLTGDEEALKEEFIEALIDRVLGEGDRSFNVDVRAASDVDAEVFTALVDTPPLLADRRIVVLRNIEHWRSNAVVVRLVGRYLERPAAGTVLVLHQGPGSGVRSELVRRARHVACDPLEPERAGRWVARRAQQLGCTITPEAVAHLLAAVGTDLFQLAREVEKAQAAAPGGEIDAGLVAELVGVRRGETVADFVTAVVSRDHARALAALPSVLALPGVTGVRLVAALGTAFVGVRLAIALGAQAGRQRLERLVFEAIRSARPPGLGDWSREAAMWAEAAARWNAGEIARALEEARRADRRLKSTTLTDELGVLTDMLLQLAAARRAA